MSAQPKTRNVRGIGYAEYTSMSDGEFRLKIYGSKERVVLHLPFYMLDNLAEELWKVQKQRARDVENSRKALRGEQ